MRPLIIGCIVLTFISCNSKKPLGHKTYGEYSIGITEDSIVKLNERLSNESKRVQADVRSDGVVLSYLVNTQKHGRSFNLYPATNTRGNIITETLFYLAHDGSITADVVRDAKVNKITNYPLISKQEATDRGENLLGYEDIKAFIENKLKENYGASTNYESVSYKDFNGIKVNETTYFWRNIDDVMNIAFVIRETEKYCYKCQNIVLLEHIHKLYSKAEMFLTYYFNEKALDKVKGAEKNDF